MNNVPLTPQQVVEYQKWTLPFVQLPRHRALKFQVANLGLQGLESASLIGERGTGKSESVKRLLQDLEQQEIAKCENDPGYQPRLSLYFVASAATGPKTILLDLEKKYLRGSGKSRMSPATLIEHLADHFHAEGYSLLCIDEAQKINGPNLDLLRQVADACLARKHPFSLLLVGSEELRDSLVEIKQQGQRFSGQITFTRLSKSEVVAVLPTLHPFVAAMQAAVSRKEWAYIEAKFVQAAAGSFRRLEKLMVNINAIALAKQVQVSPEIVEAAIAKLADEN